MKQKDDRIKDQIAKKHGNIILRFWEYDIHNNFEWIQKVIITLLKGNKNDIKEKLCEVKESYASGGGQHIRCYSPK